MFKFLHTADLHLDSPLLNLDRYDGAPVEAIRNATRRAFDGLVELAIAEGVRFILIAGDLYDGDCRDFNTPIYFRHRMEELRSHDIRVFVIQGNHDAENKTRKNFQLILPDNVHLFPTDKPATMRIDDLQVAIHGQGFAQRDICDDLSVHYPRAVRGWLNVGLLHTSCGVHDGHERYAPSSIAGLTNRGYDYWALGHIHKRQKLAGPSPWIVYPGNPQGRHIREDGPRGCVIVTVDDDRISKVETHVNDVLRWQNVAIDANGLDDSDVVLSEIERQMEDLLAAGDGRPLAVRIIVSGVTKAHRELVRYSSHWDRKVREAVLSRFDDRVWVEKIKLQTRPVTEPALWDHGDDPLGQLLDAIADADSVHAAIAEVRDEYEQLLRQLPTDPRLPEMSVSLNDRWPEGVPDDGLLLEVRELLLSRLLESGEPA
jgi:DNA repair exonuclease SbcCD nuclease subunit